MARNKIGVRERLKTLQMGQTQEEFAKRCGIQLTTLRRYLTGDRYPDSEQLTKIAENLHVSLDWLVAGRMLEAQDFSNDQIIKLCEYDPNVIEVVLSNGKAIPVVKTYDDEKSSLQFFCIHCNCWHFHGRGGKDYPYNLGRDGMAGDRSAHCFTVNSPFIKNGIILDVVGKLKELKKRPRSRMSYICEKCSNYYSAAYNTCTCGQKGKKKANTIDLSAIYREISIQKSSINIGIVDSINEETAGQQPHDTTATATNGQALAVGSRAEIHADRCGDITMQSNIQAANMADMMEVSPRERKIVELMRLHFSNARLMELEDELDDLEQAHRQRRLRNE